MCPSVSVTVQPHGVTASPLGYGFSSAVWRDADSCHNQTVYQTHDTIKETARAVNGNSLRRACEGMQIISGLETKFNPCLLLPQH